MDVKQHWENIYSTKESHQVSWTEDVPSASLSFIHQANPAKHARIIDVGGGDSKLVDYLLAEGFLDISVLDISKAAIERAKKRLGAKAHQVHWIVSDVLSFQPTKPYDLWHDRAAFHFQTEADQIKQYVELVKKSVNGTLIVGTFSTEGPAKCSGLPIQQYNETSMKAKFEAAHFKNIECKRQDHVTPMGATQNFVFCAFAKSA
jgi:trans-aconitate methyltransferase